MADKDESDTASARPSTSAHGLRSSLKEMPEVNPNSLNICEIEIGPMIGEGQFAKVYIGRMGDEHVALKKTALDDEGALSHWNRLELKVLQFCDHPHILKYVGCCVESPSYNEQEQDDDDGETTKKPLTWIVTEYVACGDLLRLLEDATAKIEWYLRIRIARELADAVSYLHGRNLMHRDIKSSNVLLDGSWHVKLGDFGMATEVCNGRASTICGTEEYMAPELHFGETESYGQPADVFSMGMVFIELATRLKVSIAAPRSPRTKFVLHDEELRTKMHAAPPSFIELAMQCVAYEDYDRVTSEDAEAWLEELELEQGDAPSTPSLGGGDLETPHSATSGERSPFALPPPLPVPAFGKPVVATRDDDELPPTPSTGIYDNAVDDASSDAHDRTRSAVLYRAQLLAGTLDVDRESTGVKPVDISSALPSNFGSNSFLAHHAANNGSVAAGFNVKPPLPTPKREKPATPGDAASEASVTSTDDPRTTSRSKLTPPGSQLNHDIPTSSSSKRNVIVLQSETTRQSGNQANSGAARGSGRGLSLLAARRIHSLREVGIETTRMAGFLHKKARTSFASRYQRRWFVLKRGTLLWFNAPGNANALGRVSLSSSAELVSTGTTKFAIFARPVLEDSSRHGSGPHAHSPSISPNGGSWRSTPTSGSGREGMSKRKPLLELMAPEETAKDMWLQALQTEIDERVVDEMRVTMPTQPDVHGFGRGLSLRDAVAVPRYLGASAPSGSDTCPERAPNVPALDQVSNVRANVARDAERSLENLQTPGINAAARNAYFKNSGSAGSQAHQAGATASRDTRGGPKQSTPSDIDVDTWIEMLNLPSETSKMFKQAGYTDVRLILEMGLNDEDLDFIGVTVPLHRRLLKDSVAEAWFTPTLQSKVVDYRICGSVALYAISSRYKYRRSTLHLRYANFVTLYAKLRAIDREKGVVHSATHEPLPKLPGSRAFVDQKGPLFLEQRRNELDEYLQKTISIAGRDERLEAAVLSFLELADGGDRWPPLFGSTLTPSSSVDGKTEVAATPRSVNLPTHTAASRNRVSHIVTPAVPVD